MKLNPFKSLAAATMGPGFERTLLGYQSGEHGYTVHIMTGKAGYGAPPHHHPHLQFNYMISGSGDFHCGNTIIPMKAGDCLQIESNEPHTFVSITEDAV